MNDTNTPKIVTLSQSEKANIKLSDLSKEIGDDFLSVDTKKKRIRKIINDNNIEYADSSAGWLLTPAQAKLIKKLYEKKWSNDITQVNGKDSKEVIHLKYAIEEREKSIATLKKQAKEYSKRIADLSNENHDLQFQQRKDHEELKESNVKLTEITKQLNISVQKANELTENQQKLTAINAQINAQLAKLQSDQSELIRKYGDAQRQISDQQMSMDDKDREIERLKEQHDKLMNRGFFARLFNKDID